jgi:hypothetical protein
VTRREYKLHRKELKRAQKAQGLNDRQSQPPLVPNPGETEGCSGPFKGKLPLDAKLRDSTEEEEEADVGRGARGVEVEVENTGKMGMGGGLSEGGAGGESSSWSSSSEGYDLDHFERDMAILHNTSDPLAMAALQRGRKVCVNISLSLAMISMTLALFLDVCVCVCVQKA